MLETCPKNAPENFPFTTLLELMPIKFRGQLMPTAMSENRQCFPHVFSFATRLPRKKSTTDPPKARSHSRHAPESTTIASAGTPKSLVATRLSRKNITKQRPKMLRDRPCGEACLLDACFGMKKRERSNRTKMLRVGRLVCLPTRTSHFLGDLSGVRGAVWRWASTDPQIFIKKRAFIRVR